MDSASLFFFCNVSTMGSLGNTLDVWELVRGGSRRVVILPAPRKFY